ncbi:MAG: hypothetical protein AB7I27_11555 [Bacteriovoracaceae bacterium]
MGLMYVFPVSTEETDFVKINENGLTLKTYGLPYIFWFYALCSITVVLFMFLAIKNPVLKLIELGDETDATLGYSLLTFVGLLPIFILGFFFYEKRILRNKNEISMEYRVFGLKVFSEKFEFNEQSELSVGPFLTTPNVARMRGGEDSAGFQNKGYFVLWLKTQNGKKILLDRHSRKADLDKLKILLEMKV